MAQKIVVLASNSPRRTQLLTEEGVEHIVFTAEVDETLTPELAADPQAACKELAERKARAAFERYFAEERPEGDYVFIGSDTMVVEGGEIFGKPIDENDAFRMINRLSGKTHEVMTSVAICTAEQTTSFVDISYVTFRKLDDLDIWEYIACGESSDKAGAYAIQGEGERLIEKFEGDWDTIVGMPVKRLLREHGNLLGI